MSTETIIEFEIQYANFLQALELQGKAPRTIAIYSTEIRKAFKYFNCVDILKPPVHKNIEIKN